MNIQLFAVSADVHPAPAGQVQAEVAGPYPAESPQVGLERKTPPPQLGVEAQWVQTKLEAALVAAVAGKLQARLRRVQPPTQSSTAHGQVHVQTAAPALVIDYLPFC